MKSFNMRLVTGIVLALSALNARATDYTWNGTTDGNFSTAANWSPFLPVSDLANTQIFLGGPGPNTTISWDSIPTFSLRTLTMTAAAPADYIINGSSTTTFQIGAGGITNNAVSRQLKIGASMSIVSGGAQTWSAAASGSSINIRGAYNNAGFATTFNTGSDTSSILFGNASSISGAGNIVITSSGAGAVLFQSANNSYTGVTDIKSGILDVASIGNGSVASGIGASTSAASNLLLEGGTLRINATAPTGFSTDRGYKVTADSTIELEKNGFARMNLSFAGPDSSIANNTTLSKTGDGSLLIGDINTNASANNLNNANFNSEASGVVASGVMILIKNGVVQVNGDTINANITVNNLGVLSGGNSSGQGYYGSPAGVSLATYITPVRIQGSGNNESIVFGSVNVLAGGKISPGGSGFSDGNQMTLVVTNSVNFNPTATPTGGTFEVDLGGSTPRSDPVINPTPTSRFHDQLRVYGAVSTITLSNAVLAATLWYAPANADKLFIIDNRTGGGAASSNLIVGTFQGLANNATFTIVEKDVNLNVIGSFSAQISYFGNAFANTTTGGHDAVIYNFQPVPEPATALTIMAGGAFLGFVRRRRFRA